MDCGSSVGVVNNDYLATVDWTGVNLKMWSDGGHRRPGCSSAGCVVKAFSPRAAPVVIVAIAELIS